MTTTHYKATIDLAKAAKLEGIPASSVQQLEQNGAPAHMPFDVWVGSDDLVRQVRFAFGQTTSGRKVAATMTMDFSDWGAHTDITAPPADDVYDATALVQKAQQQTTTAPTTTAPTS